MSKTPLGAVKDAIRNPYAFPGGYPKFILCHDGGCLCTDCARSNFRSIAHSAIADIRDGWKPEGADINWENTDLTCDNCGNKIPSAYDVEEETTDIENQAYRSDATDPFFNGEHFLY